MATQPTKSHPWPTKLGQLTKKERREHKEIVRAIEKEIAGKKPQHLKSKALGPTAKRAMAAAPNSMKQYFARFAHRDAHKLAYFCMLADPFNAPAVPIPVSITPGASPATPRCYEVELRGFMVTTTSGRGYIGANGDGWLPNITSAAGAAPTPNYLFLGNSSTYGSRGRPVHYTTGAYVGTGTGDFRSYPSPAQLCDGSAPTVLGLQLPNAFINVQGDCNPATGNAYQRFSNVAVALRCRPITPASGSLILSGTMLGVQQTLGDGIITCPAAANSPTTIGGVDAFAYVGGFTGNLAAGITPLSEEMASVTEWDMAEWPIDDVTGKYNWFTLSAIPNQSCCFGQWAPGNTGSNYVGYPQIAFLTGGGAAGQTIEFEAKYVYAYYGGVSYQSEDDRSAPRVPMENISSALVAGTPHLSGSNKTATHGAAVIAQEAVDTGMVNPGNVANWLKSGASVVEEVTGQSIGELLTDGLGAVAALLL